MKKVLIVLALVALAIVPVAAKGVAAIGLELGQPTGITFDYKIDNKWDGYVTGAFGFGSQSYIDVVIGGQYQAGTFEIGKAEFGVNVGLQGGAIIWLGDANGISIAARATASVSYDWTWKNVGDFTVYLRGALGVGIGLTENHGGVGLSGAGALGLVYHL